MRGASPDPFPAVLGYHEVFHGLTIVAAGCQYAAIAFYVLPARQVSYTRGCSLSEC